MEVEKNEGLTPDTSAEVQAPTEAQKKLAIEAADISTRNRMAEERSRVDAFMPELNALVQKYNVALIADVRLMGSGTNVQTVLNVGCQALPAKEETPLTVGE